MYYLAVVRLWRKFVWFCRDLAEEPGVAAEIYFPTTASGESPCVGCTIPLSEGRHEIGKLSQLIDELSCYAVKWSIATAPSGLTLNLLFPTRTSAGQVSSTEEAVETLRLWAYKTFRLRSRIRPVPTTRSVRSRLSLVN